MSTDLFLDVKSSVETSKPRFLYEIRQSLLIVYRLTGGDRDIVWNGLTWKADPVASSEIGLSTNVQDFEVQLTLPIRHALIQRYLAQASPPQRITLTVYEYQVDLAMAEQQWIGEITGLELDTKAHTGMFRCPSRLTRTLERRVSAISAGKNCPHILYGPDCRADATNHTVTTTVTGIDGRRVFLASITAIDTSTSFEGGDLAHVLSGERQLILPKSGIVSSLWFDLQAPIPEMHIGDVVVLRQGCNHTTAQCRLSYNNMPNYGGFPQLPVIDIFVPGNKVGAFEGD